MSCSTTNSENKINEIDCEQSEADQSLSDKSSRNRSQLKVPKTDGAIFSIPEFSQSSSLIESNKVLFKENDSCITLKSFRALRESARKEILEAAIGYTSVINPNQKSVPLPETFIVTGHQPALYHSGVWIKNFTAGLLAKKHNGVAINLIVDNDLMTSESIKVPVTKADGIHPGNIEMENIPFDTPHAKQPWEEVKIQDADLFSEFGNRVQSKIQSWNSHSVISEMWPTAVDMSTKSSSLRDCLTAARHLMERKWGNEILEIPISQLCKLPSFSVFLIHILKHLDCFHKVYNTALLEFRNQYKIRSHTHPVPDLKKEGELLEAPFWIWKKGDTKRHQLMVQNDQGTLTLSYNHIELFKVDVMSENLNEILNYELKQLNSNGYRIRTRALTTTLFARLFLGDLFIHGIGGAKYDEMTDVIIQKFYGLEPPRFLTLSATAHLPFQKPLDVDQINLERVHYLQRDLQYNPERYLDSKNGVNVKNLISEKEELIRAQKEAKKSGLSRSQRRKCSRENRQRYHNFLNVRNQLFEMSTEQEEQLKAEEQRLQDLKRENEKIQDREYSFCLFPVEKLHALMTSL